MSDSNNRFRSQNLFFSANQPIGSLPFWEHHAHSDFSDGSASVAEVIEMARFKGIERLIFTEHTEPELTGGGDWFGNYAKTIKMLRGAVADQMEVMVGLEVPILDYDGHLLLSDEMDAEVEFILGAVHAYPGHGWILEGMEPELAIDLEFRGLMMLARHPLVDAIAHPGGVCHKYVTPFPMEMFDAVVCEAVAHGKAIELNPAYQHPIAPYLEICRRRGALISPGSNAHHPGDLGLAWAALQQV